MHWHKKSKAQPKDTLLGLQKFQLIRLPVMQERIGQSGFDLIDDRPTLRQVAIELDKMLLLAGHLIFLKNRLGGAFRLTQAAINAHRRIDGEKIGAFMKRIHRADRHAICVFTKDAIICHHKNHASPPFISLSQNSTKAAQPL
jgi:hypothetical protein